jgi:hypothetical protein
MIVNTRSAHCRPPQLAAFAVILAIVVMLVPAHSLADHGRSVLSASLRRAVQGVLSTLRLACSPSGSPNAGDSRS